MSSGQEPTLEQKIDGLRQKYHTLSDKISMADITRKLGDVATEIAGLPGEIAEVRKRGYAFAGYLERKTDVLKEQWESVRQQVQEIINHEIDRVQSQFDELAGMWKRLEVVSAEKSREQNYNLIRMSVDTVERAIDSARQRIEGLYGNVPENISQTKTQLQQIKKYLGRADESTVAWKPAEAIFIAMEAEWRQSGKGKKDPDGILFLTDQRLIFEQNEKVGGRFGFGGEKVQEVLFETPVGTISEVKSEDKGVFGQTDLIHLKLSSGDYAEVTFEVKEGGIDSKWYVQQLNRVISGEIDKERAIPVDEAAAQAAREAPTVCSTCGATLPGVTRGMTEITCQYCGTLVRL